MLKFSQITIISSWGNSCQLIISGNPDTQREMSIEDSLLNNSKASRAAIPNLKEE
jgi:hypothetical protein